MQKKRKKKYRNLVNEERENKKKGKERKCDTEAQKKKREREQKTASEDAEKIALLFPFSLQPAEQIKMTTRKKNSFF